MVIEKGSIVRTEAFTAAIIFILLFIAGGAAAHTGGIAADAGLTAKAAETYGKLPLSFIKNNGQTDRKVGFYERGARHAVFFTRDGIYLNLMSSRKTEFEKKQNIQAKDERRNADKFPAENKTAETDVIRLIPLNANPSPQITAEALQTGRVSYFLGNDPEKWKTNIPTYGTVVYKDLYKGIDMKFYGDNRQLEYDIIVGPGADPSKVKFSYTGIRGLKVTEAGDLEITLKEGRIIQKRPYIYQQIAGKKTVVRGSFKIENSAPFSYGFELASYNKDYPLIIDPVLVYSTYLGGSGSDIGNSIALDSSGNAYVTGTTFSTNFPTHSPLQGTDAGGDDVFVTKINPDGNALVYSAYLGGKASDGGYGIAVDGLGNAYVTGTTSSSDFPTRAPIQAANAGGVDAFVAKINSDGSALVYSTFLGGRGDDRGLSIAVDGSGNACVTGTTKSTNFPVRNAVQGTHGADAGDNDAFVAKLNSVGSAVVYSTYLGGSGEDYGYGIAVDGAGNVYIAGTTKSGNFPTHNPIQAAIAGGSDAFVAKINPAGSALVYSTYLGGSSDDRGLSIAVDGPGNAYVTGEASSANFPTHAPIQGANAGSYDAFVTKINSDGSALVYSTYLGGRGDDRGLGIAVDGAGNAYVTGYAWSTDFPTLAPIQGANAGSYDAFVAKINPEGNAFVYSTYLGGRGDDRGLGIAADGAGNAYVTGYAWSTDFPTQNPFQGAHGGGGWDAFITKIGEQASSYTLSGSVKTSAAAAISGVTMTLSGLKSAVAATDASGNYTFTGLSNGGYTVTPVRTGYTFTPLNRAATVIGANVTGQNFTGTVVTLTLTTNKTGTGSGTITSNPSGIDCGKICSASFISGSTVSLTTAASAGSTFSGWSGACSGTISPLTTTLDKAKTCTATFTLNQYLLTVNKTGSGSGTVTGGGTYDYGSSLILPPQHRQARPSPAGAAIAQGPLLPFRC